MKVLFCHDGPLRKDEYNNYYGTAHNDGTFIRYYNVADTVKVVIRVRGTLKNEAEKKMSKITVTPFEVIEYPNISSLSGIIFKRKNAKKIIEKAVFDSEYIIARLPSVVGSIALNFAKKFNKPYLIEVVACPWDALWNHSYKGKLIAPYIFFQTKMHVKNAPYVLYVTKEFLQKRYPTTGKSIGCSDVELLKKSKKILERRIEKIDKTTKKSLRIVGTTAAVNVRYKGQEYVIEAIARLKKEGYNFHYYLFGGGDNSYLKKISEKFGVSENVKFFGSISHKNIFKHLDELDIYIQPSMVEGLPRALVEAMSRGCPSIGSKVGGIPELLNKDFTFNIGDVNKICELLKLMDREKMLNEAVRSYEVAEQYGKEKLDFKRKKFYMDFKGNF